MMYRRRRRLCAKCNGRTISVVRFVAKLFSHPALRQCVPQMLFEVPICENCRISDELPVVDATSQEILDWRPTAEVVASGNEVIYA